MTNWKVHLALAGLFRLRINAGRAIDKINRYTAQTTLSVSNVWPIWKRWSTKGCSRCWSERTQIFAKTLFYAVNEHKFAI